MSRKMDWTCESESVDHYVGICYMSLQSERFFFSLIKLILRFEQLSSLFLVAIYTGCLVIPQPKVVPVGHIPQVNRFTGKQFQSHNYVKDTAT